MSMVIQQIARVQMLGCFFKGTELSAKGCRVDVFKQLNLLSTILVLQLIDERVLILVC